MPSRQSGLTKSLAIRISFLVLVAPLIYAENILAEGLRRACGPDAYVAIGKSTSSPEAVRLRAMLRDLPEIKDPVEFVRSFDANRDAWNLANPLNRNNFPVPEMQHGVDTMIRLLGKVRRPPANRAAAEDSIRRLEQLKRDGLPYRDSVLSVHEASELIALKNPKPGEPRLKEIDIAQFRRENESDYAGLASLMETEIFVITGHRQSVDGLAESMLLGTRAIEIAPVSAKIDNMMMNPRERIEHDVAHAMMSTRDETTRAIRTLPLETRVQILRDVERLDSRKQRLARFAIYQTAHEEAKETAILRLYQPSAYQMIRTEYRELFGRDITTEDARWIQEWYRENIGLRIKAP